MEMNIKTFLIRALCGSLITLLVLAGILSVYIYGKGIDAIAICIAFYAIDWAKTRGCWEKVRLTKYYAVLILLAAIICWQVLSHLEVTGSYNIKLALLITLGMAIKMTIFSLLLMPWRNEKIVVQVI
ncbi:hypothetical protein [Citrobacter braakii]